MDEPDIFSLLGPGLIPGQAVARTKVDGLVVSTVNTTDLGYETAVIDSEGVYPVERYASLAEAEAGHAQWVALVPGRTTVTCLGYGSLVNDEVVTLRPDPW